MLKDYINLPEYINNIGNVYPVNVLEYERFKELASKYIVIDKRQIEVEKHITINLTSFEIVLARIEQFTELNKYYLRGCLDEKANDIFMQMPYLDIDEFIEVLSIILKRNDIIFDDIKGRFIIGKDIEDKFIDKSNFDKFKKIVMRQNLLFTPLYYEDRILQGLLNNLRKQKNSQDNGEGVDLETILQILSLKKGVNPQEFQNYTYYQAMSDFSRLQLIENYEWIKGIQTSGFGSKDIEIPNIFENINLNKHPEANLIPLNSSVYQNADEF